MEGIRGRGVGVDNMGWGFEVDKMGWGGADKMGWEKIKCRGLG